MYYELYLILLIFTIALIMGVFFVYRDRKTPYNQTDIKYSSNAKLHKTSTNVGKILGIQSGKAIGDVTVNQEAIIALKKELESQIVGQADFITLLLLAVISQSHMYIQSLPGLAKTSAVKVLCAALGLQFGRIQGTPDLLPSDILGFEKADGSIKEGILLHNLILFDEINRASPKLQSAVLQAMEERTITVGSRLIPLPRPFIVFATANPQGSKGIYQLPEAQMDRFGLSIYLSYPRDEEKILLQDNSIAKNILVTLNFDDIYDKIKKVYFSDYLLNYVKDLLEKTRNNPEIVIGCSPRAGKDIIMLAKALAWIQGNDDVSKYDVDILVPYCRGHRVTMVS